MRRPGTTRRTILALVVSVWCATPLVHRSLQPFISTADKDAAMYAQAARNYVRYGLVTTRLGMTLATGEAPPTLTWYDHHPPGAALGAAAVYAVLGVADWTTRVYPGLCSLGSALCLFLIWRRHRGSGPALLAAVVLATLPAYGHFGLKLGEEAPTFFWVLLCLFLWQRWKDDVRAGAAGLIPCLAAYAIACASGWAAFHAGPLLMIDAWITLRGDPLKRRAALPLIAITGIGSFALVMGHIAWLTGSLDDVLEAARGRLFPPGGVMQARPGIGDWIAREAGWFVRLFGVRAVVAVVAGAIAAVVALARGRWRADAVMGIVVLTGFGAAHVIAFPWAAYYHDWMLFHLLAVVSIAAAEGILLPASILSGGLRRIGSPAWIARGAAGIVVAAAIGALATAGAQGLRTFATETRRYAWPILADRIREMAPPDAPLMASIRIGSHPIRFYLDRSFAHVESLADLRERIEKGKDAIFLRHLNAPIDAEMEAFLSTQGSVDLAGFRIHALGAAPSADEDVPMAPGGVIRIGSIDADFEGRVRLTGYRIEGPVLPPDPVPGWRRFLGLREGTLSRDRIVRVITEWSTDRDALPDWTISTYMRHRTPGGALLPLVALDEVMTPLLSAWSGYRSFRIHADFLMAEDSPAGEYEFNLVVSDAGGPVPPTLPGPPRPGIKMVQIAPVPIPGP